MWRRPHRHGRAHRRRAAARMPGLFVLTGLFLAACSGLSATPVSIVVRPVATATGWPTSTQPSPDVLTAMPSATVTPPEPTPSPSGLRTKTPVPGSPSPEPSATRRIGGSGAPASTATPTPPALNGGSLDTRAHGVTGNLQMEKSARVYEVGEQMWFRWSLTNVSSADLTYGHIGVVPSTGDFHTSWSGSSLRAGNTAHWRDWVSFTAPGEYTLVLAICLSSASVCENGGQWVDLTAPLSVTVR